MLEGHFVESGTDEHVALRTRLLACGSRLPAPAAAESLDAVWTAGLAVGEYGEPLVDDEFLALGGRLGEAMPETAPAVQPFVEHGVILNLISEHAATDDVDLQPFATNHLTLHSESSARPLAEQPRFIVLMCVEPGDASADAQTVLVPMASVARALGDDERAVLSRTRYRRSAPDAAILRRVDGRDVFAFRDFSGDELLWTHDGDDAGENDVNGAIRALLAAMYAPDAASGVGWRRGRLVAIDNTFFFHGRTAGSGAKPGRRRHLKRLRILARDGGGDG